MTQLVTLIAGPGATALAEVAAAVGVALQARADWLAPGTACDLFFDGLDPAAAETLARAAIADAPIDVLLQPAQGRRKRILAADFESTIIENEMLDELAEFVGMRAEVSEITRRAMNGELDFAAALAERVALLRGLPASVLDEAGSR